MLPGTRTRFGPVREVVTEETLSESFGVPVRLVPENLPERPGYTSVIAVGKTKTATAGGLPARSLVNLQHQSLNATHKQPQHANTTLR